MHASGGGSIVNMASVATHLGYPVFFAYSAAKGAVRGMSKSIAVWCQMQKYDIRCNSLHPGATDTPMVAEANRVLGIPDEYYTSSGPGLGRPEDVANVVVFLASDESRFINGAELVLDNALTIQ
jgi:3(or 17)beta-hydroxysteroid dehydrogenase